MVGASTHTTLVEVARLIDGRLKAVRLDSGSDCL